MCLFVCVCVLSQDGQQESFFLLKENERNRYKSLTEEGEWGWGMMKWTEDKAGRGWGVKVKQ